MTPTCSVCGKIIPQKEMEKDITGNLFGNILGENAQYMPNIMQGLAMKCNKCDTWICSRCAEKAASGAGAIKHANCGGMFQTPR